MERAKKVAMGLAMTALAVAAVVFIVNRFAPEGVKQHFRVA